MLLGLKALLELREVTMLAVSFLLVGTKVLYYHIHS